MTAVGIAYEDAKSAIEASKNASNAMSGDQSLVSETPKIGRRLSSGSHDEITARLVRDALDKQALAARMVGLREAKREADALKTQALLGKVSRRSSEYLRAEIRLADQTKDLHRAVTALDRWASMSPAKRKEIFPVLLLALAETGGAALIKQREARLWYAEFVTSASLDPKKLQLVARYLLQYPMPPSELRDQLMGAVVSGYLVQNEVAQAQDFAGIFGQLNVDWSSIAWHDPNNTYANLPLFWQYSKSRFNFGMTKTGDLYVYINSGFGRQIIAKKRMSLPPNRKVLIRVYIKSSEGRPDQNLVWSVSCGTVNIYQKNINEFKIGSNESVAAVTFFTRSSCPGYEISLKYDYDPGISLEHSLNISQPSLYWWSDGDAPT